MTDGTFKMTKYQQNKEVKLITFVIMSDIYSNLASGHSWFLSLISVVISTLTPSEKQKSHRDGFWGGSPLMDVVKHLITSALCVYSATTAARCDVSLLPWSLGQEQHCLILLCSTRLQRNFHYFQSCCSFLGGPRHVSAPSMRKYVSV